MSPFIYTPWYYPYFIEAMESFIFKTILNPSLDTNNTIIYELLILYLLYLGIDGINSIASYQSPSIW